MNPQTLAFVNQVLGLGTIAGQVLILVLGLGFMFREQFPKFFAFFGKNGLALAFVVAVVSVAGSLFYSNIAGFEPCVLCWYQRIFMYPLVVVLSMGLIKKSKQVIEYVMFLPIIGLIIALYHNYIYYAGTTGCLFAGKGVSCTQRYVFELGYITIPMMALTAFWLIILFLSLARLYRNDKGI